MKRMLAAALAALLSAEPVFAWGKIGHRVSAEIAERRLSEEARAAISELMGGESLAEASTWPDFMRSSEEPFWREAGPYHFVTVPDGTVYDPANAPPEGDAYTALQSLSAVLTDASAPVEERRRALRFVVHIIADLHQPLHAGNGRDRGGNEVTVVWFDERVTTLHLAWDEDMVEHEQLSYTEMTDWLDAKITPDLEAAWMEPDPLVWIAESVAVRDSIYPDDAKLSWDYVFEHRALMRERLSQGGVRTAAYLNSLFE